MMVYSVALLALVQSTTVDAIRLHSVMIIRVCTKKKRTYRISSSYVSCQCRPGFIGNGFGQTGCVPLRAGGQEGGGALVPINSNNPCSPNPCVFGTCFAVGNGFQCSCRTGYAGIEGHIFLD